MMMEMKWNETMILRIYLSAFLVSINSLEAAPRDTFAFAFNCSLALAVALVLSLVAVAVALFCPLSLVDDDDDDDDAVVAVHVVNEQPLTANTNASERPSVRMIWMPYSLKRWLGYYVAMLSIFHFPLLRTVVFCQAMPNIAYCNLAPPRQFIYRHMI